MSDLVKRLRSLTSDRYNTFEEAADAIERKDAAIAELVGALKKLQYVYRQVEGLHEPDMHDVFTMQSQNMIAKYDIPKDGL